MAVADWLETAAASQALTESSLVLHANMDTLESSSYKLITMLSVWMCVCLDVNKGGTNRNRCTQRLVILRAQTC